MIGSTLTVDHSWRRLTCCSGAARQLDVAGLFCIDQVQPDLYPTQPGTNNFLGLSTDPGQLAQPRPDLTFVLDLRLSSTSGGDLKTLGRCTFFLRLPSPATGKTYDGGRRLPNLQRDNVNSWACLRRRPAPFLSFSATFFSCNFTCNCTRNTAALRLDLSGADTFSSNDNPLFGTKQLNGSDHTTTTT